MSDEYVSYLNKLIAELNEINAKESTTFQDLISKKHVADKTRQIFDQVINAATQILDTSDKINASYIRDLSILEKNLDNSIAAKTKSYMNNEYHKSLENIKNTSKWQMNDTVTKDFIIAEVPVVGEYTISARIVEQWTDLGSQQCYCEIGHLYFIKQSMTFGIMLSKNNFIYGGFGNILDPTQEISFVKECRNLPICNSSNCQFYHDPIKYPHKRNIRNFMNNSWVYNRDKRAEIGDKQSRVIGTRDKFRVDLAQITNVQIALFNSQVMHDILCSMLIAKYKL